MTASVATFPATVRAGSNEPESCEDRVKLLELRLEKALDAYEKAIGTISTDRDLLAAKDQLIGLYKEWMGVKDQMIADLKADNDFLRKKANGSKSRLQRIFDKIEKYLILGAGIYIGKGL